jgi:hypothetical protein
MLIWKMENNILEDVSDPTHCSLQKKSPIGSAVQLTNSVNPAAKMLAMPNLIVGIHGMQVFFERTFNTLGAIHCSTMKGLAS